MHTCVSPCGECCFSSFSKNSTTFFCPSSFAYCRGVQPLLSLKEASSPWRRSHWTAPKFPYSAAKWSADIPSRVTERMSHVGTNASIEDTWPPMLARWIAVMPAERGRLLSISRPRVRISSFHFSRRLPCAS